MKRLSRLISGVRREGAAYLSRCGATRRSRLVSAIPLDQIETDVSAVFEHPFTINGRTIGVAALPSICVLPRSRGRNGVCTPPPIDLPKRKNEIWKFNMLWVGLARHPEQNYEPLCH